MNKIVTNPKSKYVSIILPTYNEADNIKDIIPKISETLENENIKGEVIVVDDDSPDGTADIARNLGDKYNVRTHVRKNKRGLATAVMKGFELAKGDICLVMDADLSHPVTKIPEMIKPIIDGECDAVVGSRYVAGGSSQNWQFIRKILSKGAGLFARGLTRLSDPTSGFIAFRKDMLDRVKLNPVGWKIVLEFLVKTNCRFKELPIMFNERSKGKSKLNFKVQIDYIHHLWKLYCFKYDKTFQFIKFCLVGASGLLVDTLVLVILVELVSFDPRFAAVFGFIAAVSSNYILNRLWTFNIGKIGKLYSSYISFVSVCILGLLIRIGVMHLLIEYAGMDKDFWYILASFLGIVAATVFNYVGSRYFVFSENFICKNKKP